MKEGEFVIKFHCKNCGQKIRVPQTYAGKKGKCPKCKNMVVIPKAKGASLPISQSDSAESEISSKYSDFDLTFLDVPQKEKDLSQPAGQDSMPDKALEDLQGPEESLDTDKSEPVGKRKLPWLIDIFIYPISIPGLTNLAIFIGVPLLINILGTILPIRLSYLFGLVSMAVNILVFFYIYWYFAECVRDSADGGVRAPEGLGATPGLAGMFWQTVNVIGCLAVFFGPFVFYILFAKRADIIFWLLLIYAVFLFPMGLLAVVMFDSAVGLNPRLLIRSISSTFFLYCGLVLLFVTAVSLIGMLGQRVQEQEYLAFIIRCVSIYLVFVGAHLLGWFYWKYRDKLNWEV